MALREDCRLYGIVVLALKANIPTISKQSVAGIMRYICRHKPLEDAENYDCLCDGKYPTSLREVEETPRKTKSHFGEEELRTHHCLECGAFETLEFTGGVLQETKQAYHIPSKRRGRGKTTFIPAGKWTQRDGRIYHRHLDKEYEAKQVKGVL